MLGELWPVCLPEKEVASYAGSRATVIGWGKTSGKQSFSSARTLQELEVSVISQEECQRQWSYGKGRVEIGGPRCVLNLMDHLVMVTLVVECS